MLFFHLLIAYAAFLFFQHFFYIFALFLFFYLYAQGELFLTL